MRSPQTRQTVDARVDAARTRISFGPVPSSSFTAAGLVVVLGSLCVQSFPSGLPPLAWAWLGWTFVSSFAFALHALVYLKSQLRDASHWWPTHIAMTVVSSTSWAAGLWMLPLGDNHHVEVAVIAAILGVTTTGSSLLVGYKWLSRLWALPPMISMFAYTTLTGGMLGTYWAVFCTGILALHWANAGRKERHLKEMLRLRYAHEDMLQAREEALTEAKLLSEAKSGFLATTSHEMRTPLHGILGLARMLESEHEHKNRKRQLQLLRTTAEHLLTVINDVLDYSKLRAQRLEIHAEATDIAALTRNICDLADVTARAKAEGAPQTKPVEVLLDLSLLPEPCWMVDPARLRQILLNLMGNAVKFTERGHVKLTVALLGRQKKGAEGSRILFTVEDTGIGIPPAHVSKVFDAFHQVGHKGTQGTGLGLSIAKQLCEAMGANLGCKSTVGKGSSFSFVLPTQVVVPAEPSPRVAATREPPAHSPALQGLVLIVDDNPVNLLVTEAQLQKMGLDAHCANSARAALDWLDKHRADLILMDCHMPDMDGFEATQVIRRHELALGLQRTPIVAMTASNVEMVDNACLTSGMDGVLAKPSQPDEMANVLQKLMGRPPPARESADLAGVSVA
jgi:signal transduction histidine kinase/CheY-like chemotaxis protein